MKHLFTIIVALLCANVFAADESFFGRVVKPDGQPMAGAHVWLVEWSDDSHAHTTAEAASDSDGMFKLQRIGQVVVKAEGFGFSGTQIVGNDAKNPTPVTLKPATELHVNLIAPDGKPAAGVRVAPSLCLWNSDAEPGVIHFSEELKDQFAAKSDEAGVCVIPGLPQSTIVNLAILDDRFAMISNRQSITLAASAVSEGGVIHLQPAGSISGRVIFGHSGKPAAKVPVSANDTRRGGTGAFAAAITNENGEYHLAKLPAGDYSVVLQLDSEMRKKYVAANLIGVTVATGANVAGKDFSLISGGTITGKVVEKLTNKPVPNMNIRIRSVADTMSFDNGMATTAADGTYTVHVVPGEQAVYFSSTPPAGLLQPLASQQTITVAADQTVTVDFQLPPDTRPSVTVHAADVDGNAVAGAQILVDDKTDRTFRRIQNVTDARGNAAIVGLNKGALLHACKGNSGTVKGVAFDGTADELTLVIQKDVVGSAIVKVQQEDGTPIAGARVGVFQWLSNLGSPQSRGQTSGADGTCVLTMLYPGMRYTASADVKGYGRSSVDLKIQPGKQIDAPPLVLFKADNFVAGLVMDAAGEPMPGVELVIGGGHTSTQTTTTDESGHFKFDNVVTNDRVQIYCRDRALQARPQEIKPGTADAVIVVNKRGQ